MRAATQRQREITREQREEDCHRKVAREMWEAAADALERDQARREQDDRHDG